MRRPEYRCQHSRELEKTHDQAMDDYIHLVEQQHVGIDDVEHFRRPAVDS